MIIAKYPTKMETLKRFILSAVVLLGAAFPAFAQSTMRTIEIGHQVTTHILFGSDLTYVDISSPDMIAAKVVDASKNMLALKARKEFAFQTTVSALEANGTMHTFYVRYNSSPMELLVDMRSGSSVVSGSMNTQIQDIEDSYASSAGSQQGQGYSSQPQQGSRPKDRNNPQQRQQNPPRQGPGVNVATSQGSNFGRQNAPTINEVMRKKRSLFHVSDKSYRLEADCINIFAYSDQVYIVLRLKNNSDIGYEAGDAQFTVESKKTSAKTLSTDKSVWPRSSFGTLSCAPGAETFIGYTLPKLTLQKNELLRIYIYEKGGNRNLFLSLTDSDVNYAVSPFQDNK